MRAYLRHVFDEGVQMLLPLFAVFYLTFEEQDPYHEIYLFIFIFFLSFAKRV